MSSEDNPKRRRNTSAEQPQDEETRELNEEAEEIEEDEEEGKEEFSRENP